MAPQTQSSERKEKSSGEEEDPSDVAKESSKKESFDKGKESSKKIESSGIGEASKPSKWTTMPVIGFLLALNTTWLIWPRLKALGGEYKLLY